MSPYPREERRKGIGTSERREGGREGGREGERVRNRSLQALGQTDKPVPPRREEEGNRDF